MLDLHLLQWLEVGEMVDEISAYLVSRCVKSPLSASASRTETHSERIEGTHTETKRP